ncbi:MAG: hypothetical protein R2716_04545 [Microthrixaceae bacterium]
MDLATRERWAAVLNSMQAALASGEHVGPLVCGRVRGSLAAVARTDRRILVVVERPGRMAVESLHPVATGVGLKPAPGGSVVVVLVDRGRLLELTGVTAVAEAEGLAVRQAIGPAARAAAGDPGGIRPG